MGLRPDASVQKVLISSTCRFYGEFETSDLLITQAWSGLSGQGMPTASIDTLPRNSFVCSFRTRVEEEAPGLVVPNFTLYGDLICICLALLFGKRFDNHGPLETGGMFLMPDLRVYGQESATSLPQNTSKPRVDYPIALNLTEVARFEALLTGVGALHETKAARAFGGAAKFYLQALQSVERDAEIAYLNLITAGEILSNFFEYPREDVLDDTSKKLIHQLREVPDGCKLATHVENKLRSTKTRFVRTVVGLVDAQFFERTQSSAGFAALRQEDFVDRIKAAYDLRSKYLHTGMPFGWWVARPQVPGAETPITGSAPVLNDKELVKILRRAPTYTGMERVMRYCLLRFAEANGLINPWTVIGATVPSVDPATPASSET
jgi:hypothetical protein